MLSKAKAKTIRSLKNKKYREESGLFIVEGQRSCEEVLNSGLEVDQIYATEEFVRAHKELLHKFDTTEITVTNKELESVTQLKTPNEVLIVCKQNAPLEFQPKADSFYIALDDIRDPGNLGTIIRIADWFGITDVLCSQECADVYNPKVIQACMGSFIRVNVHYVKLEEHLTGELQSFAASTRGTDLTKMERPKGGILLIGNEAHGIHPSLGEKVDQWVSIPGKGGAESLNASVATGIICSHWVN